MGTVAGKRGSYERTRAVNLERDPHANGGSKSCNRCKETKSVSFFSADLSSKDGLRTVCKGCRNLMQRVINGGGDYESYRELAPNHNKRCTCCGYTKVLDDFPTQKAGKGGRNAQCRTCCNMKRRASAYNVSLDDLSAMLAAQDGKCASCSVELTLSGKGRGSVAVDHCHSTGKVRGLLCCGCNGALGMLGDDAETVGGLYEYIRRSQWRA
jgi:hypothetical protein